MISCGTCLMMYRNWFNHHSLWHPVMLESRRSYGSGSPQHCSDPMHLTRFSCNDTFFDNTFCDNFVVIKLIEKYCFLINWWIGPNLYVSFSLIYFWWLLLRKDEFWVIKCLLYHLIILINVPVWSSTVDVLMTMRLSWRIDCWML